MRAAVVTAPSHVEIREVPAPEPGSGQVRVKLEGCGVCGSNLPPWEGRPWFKYPFQPGELGHEGWGTVDATGPGATRFRAGDRVAVLSYKAYAEYDVAPESAVVALPPGLASQPMPGEPLGCAMNVFRRCDVSPGQTVAIIGIGFLGAVLTALCSQAGARVIALSRRPYALQIASQVGAQTTLPLADHHKIISDVFELTGGNGCDRVIEAVGMQWPLDLAGELTRERGKLIIAGYHQDGPRQVNMQLWNWRGLDVVNAHERDPNVYTSGIEAAVEAIAGGKLNPGKLMTHRFPLERLGDALNLMKDRSGAFLKAYVHYEN